MSDTKNSTKAITKTAIKIKERPKLDISQLVYVVNGFHGRLVYQSPKTGYKVVFDHFGDGDYLELSELIVAKNTAKGFFTKNWFLIDDLEVLEYLGVEQYYKDALNIEEFESVFDLDEKAMTEKIANISEGQKRTLSNIAWRKIQDGEIDSRKTITALENILGEEFIEK